METVATWIKEKQGLEMNPLPPTLVISGNGRNGTGRKVHKLHRRSHAFKEYRKLENRPLTHSVMRINPAFVPQKAAVPWGRNTATFTMPVDITLTSSTLVSSDRSWCTSPPSYRLPLSYSLLQMPSSPVYNCKITTSYSLYLFASSPPFSLFAKKKQLFMQLYGPRALLAGSWLK